MVRGSDDERARLALLSIAVVGLYLRVRGITFGLPNTLCRPDEAYIINIAMRFGTGDLNPHSFFYPSLYFYVLFTFYILYFVAGRLVGHFGSVTDFVSEYHLDPTGFFLIDRLLVALLGAATIIVVYRVARELFDTRTGLIAAFFTSVAFLHVRDSHFGTTDVPLTFLVVLALFLVVKMREAHSWRSYLVAGLTVGLASSIKHSGALMLIPGWVAHALNARDEGSWTSLVWDKRPWLFSAVALLAFVITTPFAVLDWPTFVADLQLQFRELGGILYYKLERGWRAHATFSLFYGLGWPVLAASLVGLVMMLLLDWKKTLVVASFPIVYYAVFGRGYAVSVRYAVPLVPFLCIMAAVACGTLAARLGSLLGQKRTRWAVILVGLLALPTIRSSILFGRLLSKEDTRLVAAKWIADHVPQGSSIYQAASPYGLIRLNRIREFLEDELRQTQTLGGQGAGPKAKLAQAGQAGVIGHDEWMYDDQEGFLRVRKPIRSLPDYIVAEDSPLVGYRREADRIKPLLRQSYELAVYLEGVDTADPENRFDQQDVFYVPYAGFHAKRPGPGLGIYRRRDLPAKR